MYLLLICMIVLSGCQALLQDEQNRQEFHGTALDAEPEEDRYLVVYKKKQHRGLVQRMGGRVLRGTKHLPLEITRMPEQTRKALEKNPNILLIEKDQKVKLVNEVQDWGIGALAVQVPGGINIVEKELK